MQDRLTRLSGQTERLAQAVEQQQKRIVQLEEQLKKNSCLNGSCYWFSFWRSMPNIWQFGYFFCQALAVLFFATGVILLYSHPTVLFTPLMRIGGGMSLGMLMLLSAEYRSSAAWQHRRYLIVSGGIALLFSGVFTAYTSYNLINLSMALIGLLLITGMALMLALRHNSFVLALSSLLGGMIIPLLLCVPLQDVPFLLTYQIILATCFLLLSYYKEWFSISWASFAILVAYKLFFIPLGLHGALLFLGAIFLLYNIVPYAYVLVRQPAETAFELWMILISGLYVAGAITDKLIYHNFFLLKELSSSWLVLLFGNASRLQVLAYVSLVFGVVYALFFVGSLRWYKCSDFTKALATLMSFCFAVAIVSSWHGLTLSCALFCYAFGLLLAGLALPLSRLRSWSYTLWIVAFANAVLAGWHRPISMSTTFVLEVSLTICIATILALASSALLDYFSSVLDSVEYERMAGRFASMAVLLPFYWTHTIAWPYPYNILGLAVLGALCSFLIWYRRQRSIRGVTAYVLIFSLAYWLVAHDELVINYPLFYIAICGLFGFAGWMYWRHEVQGFKIIKNELIGDVWAGVMFLLASRCLLLQIGIGVTGLLTYYTLMALMLLGIGFRIQHKGFQLLGLGTFCVAGVRSWILIVGVENGKKIAMLVGLGLVLMLISILYQTFDKKGHRAT